MKAPRKSTVGQLYLAYRFSKIELERTGKPGNTRHIGKKMFERLGSGEEIPHR
jgi:hypothetical protein